MLNSITNPSALGDFLAANLQAEAAEKQLMLEELDVEKRLRMIAARLATQLDVLELQSKIQSQVKENIDKSQRRYYLQEQMKAIRKELGEAEGGTGSEIDVLREDRGAGRPIRDEGADRSWTLRQFPATARVRRHPHLSPDRQRAAMVRDGRQARP